MIDLITIYFMFFISLLVFSIIPYIIGKIQETSNRIETRSKNQDKNQDSFLDKILSDKDFKSSLEKELNILRIKKGLPITNPEETKADLKEVKENKKHERYDSFFNSTALNLANKLFSEMDIKK